jgi:hypothetical protein
VVYSSHDAEHNNAVALQRYLRAKVRRRATPNGCRTSSAAISSMTLI